MLLNIYGVQNFYGNIKVVWYLKKGKKFKILPNFFFLLEGCTFHLALTPQFHFSFFKDVYSADGIRVVKKECIGHVQK